MNLRVRFAVVIAMVLLISGCGITAGRGEGYARFTAPHGADRVVGISLGSLPLKLARIVVDNDDPEAAMLLKGIRGVRVYVYELDHAAGPGVLSPTLDALGRQGWQSVVAMREDGERAHVLLKLDRRDEVRGMVVLVAEGRELTMVNLMGTLRPEMFNAYMDDLDIDAPQIEVDSS